MADNRSKAFQKPANSKKSVKQNRNSIRLSILPLIYTIISPTTAGKIVQTVASFSQTTEPQIQPENRMVMAEASRPFFPHYINYFP